jgi:hypothetical protein
MTFYDPEHVDRPVPDRPWRAIVLAVVLATAALTIGWEIYWRSQSYVAGDFKNTPALWAQERRKVTGDATVLLGSSRIFYDTDLDVWEETAGVRPIQLALEGTSPEPFLADLAADEDFRGTVIVGVAAPILFTGYAFRKGVLDYTRDQSPSQRADHGLSKQLEKLFAFIDEQTRPKRILHLASLPLRPGMEKRIDVRKLEVIAEDRNTEVWVRLIDDEPYRELAKYVWAEGIRREAPQPGPNGEPPPPMPDEAIEAMIGKMKASVDKIRARGGEVAFVRYPYEGAYTAAEDGGFPRQRFWDRLVAETDSAGVAWQDYPQLQGYYLPEWSHIEARDAERYTAALVPILYAEIEKKNAERRARLSGLQSD